LAEKEATSIYTHIYVAGYLLQSSRDSVQTKRFYNNTVAFALANMTDRQPTVQNVRVNKMLFVIRS
jgi:hypothetical protein